MTDVRDFLDGAALTLAVTGGLFDRVDTVASTGSTNADLARAAREGAPPGLVLLAAHQSTGRGRLARHWQAPPDTSIACSVLLAPRRPVADWGWLPLLVGLAVTDGVRAATGLDVTLKWPNDVLVGERKLCGILCEAVGDANPPLAVLGWGLNVALTPEQLPVPTATSTRIEGSDAHATDIAAAILRALETHVTRWDAGASLTQEYRERCGTIGREVVVRLSSGAAVRGVATGVDADGGLMVRTDTGERTFVAGDVEHLRPADAAQDARNS